MPPPLTITTHSSFGRVQRKSREPMASQSPESSCVYTRQAPLYPRYQVVGRDPLGSVWLDDDEDVYDETPRWARDPDVVVQKPLERNMSFESAPTPTPPRLPTFDVSNDRIATAPNAHGVGTHHDGLNKQEPPQLVGKKRQRYLRDVERRSIILRIDNGEKQAALAREFGVTRAAICHMKKNRVEIVSRYESLLASAKELERTTQSTRTNEVSVLTQPAVQLLLTAVRDATTSHRTFRASAKRLMTLLLEEAMASATTVATTVCTTTGQTIRGLKATMWPLCCVGVGEKGWPLVQRYREIEPQGSIGGVGLVTTSNGPIVDYLDLPRGLTANTGILLVSVSSATGESLCASVQALLRAGVAVDDIRCAAIVCSSGAVDRLKSAFPEIRILTCAIEPSTPRAPPATTLCDFLDRFDAIKREPSTEKDSSSLSRASMAASGYSYERW